MKPIESLKARLSNDKLLVQNEKGFLSTVGFEWNPAATDKEIAEFETVLHHQLPAEFKEFLKISNGATFFKDLDYGQWGFHILSLAELSEIQSKVTTWGYDLKPGWLPFVTCLGDCDILLFDLNRYEQNNTNYILYGDQEERVENWAYIKGGFQKWIDRLIVSQGSKYWSWF